MPAFVLGVALALAPSRPRCRFTIDNSADEALNRDAVVAALDAVLITTAASPTPVTVAPPFSILMFDLLMRLPPDA
ncbi:hypothetical protein IG631_23213 [Alternaria alternata]|nr:hypothetical protein IG631_23213 [Alternaria alternata]